MSVYRERVKVPQSSLRLWLPPLRLLSALTWKVAEMRQVEYYNKLEEFVSVVMEIVPDLLSAKERVELCLGLRARFILDLCCDQPSLTLPIVQPHLDRLFWIAESASIDGVGDGTVEASVRNFVDLIQTLLRSPTYREHFFQDIYPLHYGYKYDTALQFLVWEFLSRLEELLPVPSFYQAACWFEEDHSLLEDSLKMVYNSKHVQDLLLHFKNIEPLDTGSSSSVVMANTILSSLSASLSPCGQAEKSVSALHVTQGSLNEAEIHMKVEDSCGDVEKEDRCGDVEEEDRCGDVEEEDIQRDVEEEDGCGDVEKEDRCGDVEEEDRCGDVEEEDRCGDVEEDSSGDVEEDSSGDVEEEDRCGDEEDIQRDVEEEDGCGDVEKEDRCGDVEEDSSGDVEEEDRCGDEEDIQRDVDEHDPQRHIDQCKPRNMDEKQNVDKKSEPNGEEIAGDTSECESTVNNRSEQEVPTSSGEGPGVSSPQGYLLKMASTSVNTAAGSTKVFLRHACNECDKAFYFKSSLTSHKKIHGIRTRERPLCSICGKTFTCRSSLASHMRIHTGERPYRCSVCDKGFTQGAALVVHKRLHSGERPYLCSVCGKGFLSSGGLLVHTRFHTGERPYKCEFCGKCYAVSESLVSHRRVHTREKPYACTVCKKQFSNQTGVQRHMLIHTGKKPHECRVCGKRFTQRYNMRIHQRVHR